MLCDVLVRYMGLCIIYSATMQNLAHLISSVKIASGRVFIDRINRNIRAWMNLGYVDFPSTLLYTMFCGVCDALNAHYADKVLVDCVILPESRARPAIHSGTTEFRSNRSTCIVLASNVCVHTIIEVSTKMPKLFEFNPMRARFLPGRGRPSRQKSKI